MAPKELHLYSIRRIKPRFVAMTAILGFASCFNLACTDCLTKITAGGLKVGRPKGMIAQQVAVISIQVDTVVAGTNSSEIIPRGDFGTYIPVKAR